MVHDSSARTAPCSRACDAPACTDMQQASSPGPRRGELSLPSSAQVRASPSGRQRGETPIPRAHAPSSSHAALRSLRARASRRAQRSRSARARRCVRGARRKRSRDGGHSRSPAGPMATCAPVRSRGELPASDTACASLPPASDTACASLPPASDTACARSSTSRECDAACAHAEEGWRRGETAFHSASDVACAC